MSNAFEINKHVCLKNFSNILLYKGSSGWRDGWETIYNLRQYFAEADFRFSEMRFNLISRDVGIYKGLLSPADMITPILYVHIDYELGEEEFSALEEFLINRHKMFRTTILSTSSSELESLYKNIVENYSHPRFRVKYSSEMFMQHALNDFLGKEIELLNPDAEILGFIDIDGVLQNIPQFFQTGWAGHTSTVCRSNPLFAASKYHVPTVDFMKSLSLVAGVKWVMCSSQRKIFTDEERVLWGKLLGIDVIGKTESLGSRSEEIMSYINKSEHLGKVVIMDDEKFEYDGDIDVFQPALGVRKPIDVDEMMKTFTFCNTSIYAGFRGIDFS